MPTQPCLTNPLQLMIAVPPVRAAIVPRRFRVDVPFGRKLNAVRLRLVGRISDIEDGVLERTHS
jgi:hypothetical protein